jgi:hypothetical protein
MLTGISGLFLAFSTHVRTVSIFLIWFLSPLIALLPQKRALNNMKKTGMHLLALVMGFLVIAAAYQEFYGYAISRDSWLRRHLGENTQTEAGKTEPGYATSVPYMKVNKQLRRVKYNVTPVTTYQDIRNSLVRLKYCMTPPEFHIRSPRFVDKKLESIYKYGNKQRTTKSFGDFPIQYITWNFWGKYATFWNWNNIYVGDVYIYPMIQSGFEVNLFLKFIYMLMHIFHTPLYIMSICGLIFFFIRWIGSSGIFPEQVLAVPAFGFIYFHGICTILAWLPRYSIPVRPFSYILAAAMLIWTIRYLKRRLLVSYHMAIRQNKGPK